MKRILLVACMCGWCVMARGADISSLFPASGEITGWTTDSAVAVCDTHTIWGRIDGGAVPYVDNGMESAGFQLYKNGGNEISVQLYAQDTAPHALTVYNVKRLGYLTYETAAGLGDSSRVDKTPMFNYNLEFVRGQYYAFISCPNTEPMFTEAKIIAAAMDAKITGQPISRATTQTTWGRIKAFFTK
jgi:hypothetical protein